MSKHVFAICVLWLALCCAAPAAAQNPPAKAQRTWAQAYFGKPIRYLILDALILSSPITGVLAVVAYFDPAWRERPRGWWYRGRYEEVVRRTLWRKFRRIAAFGTLAFLGAMTFIFHLLDLIP